MRLTVALISDVFHDGDGVARLEAQLRTARAGGATLAVLPELPLNPWSPATEVVREDDAEESGGARSLALATAARSAAIGVIGGAIIRDSTTGRRHNTALVFDASGTLVASYQKVHLPDEDGFRETRHYEPGDQLSPVIDAFGLRLGLQICSDINRPEGSHVLGALGADAIINPRATEAATFSRWRTVLLANAMTSGVYVVSVNRPREEHGVPLGGPSFVAAPTGEIVVETTDPLAIVTLDREIVREARRRYPGYLAVRADLYAGGWKSVESTRLPHQ
jgi:predicted amidohydrolase